MLEVRPAMPDDEAAVQAVDAAATATLRETYRPNQAGLTNAAKLVTRLERLVATVNGHVVGTVRYGVENRFVRIVGLGVHPNFRGRGVARALLAALEAIGRHEGASRLRLFTVKQTGNVDLFKHLGFRVVGERVDEFSESDKYKALTNVEMEKHWEQIE